MNNTADIGKVFNLTGGSGGDGSLRLESIAVTRAPTKTTYKSGESFDPTGMVVTGTYAFGLTSDVTGYTVTPSVLTDGISEVTITYTEGRVTKTTSTPVTVEKVLTGISVTTPPTKTTYNYLENFAPAGMVVTANFSDGSSAPVSTYSYPSGQFTTLGNQPVEISYTYEGVTKTDSQIVTVNAIQVSVPTQKNVPTYDGTLKTPEWDNFDSLKMTKNGDLNGTNAKDTYTTIFTLVYGYVFPNATDEVSVQWAIKRAPISALPTQINVPAADGTTKTPSWSGYDSVKMTISGDQSGTVAGDYTATFTPTANYMWWDETTGPKNVTWSIASILVTIPTQKNVPTYNGAAKTPEWDNFDEDHSTVVVTPATNAGEYDATFTLLQGMWTDGETTPKTIHWTIDRAELGAVPEQDGTLVYDGNPKTPSWNASYDSTKMDVTVQAQVNAGTAYTATFTPKANYKWPDGSIEGKTATWAIGKGTYTPTASPSSITLNTSARTASFVVSRQENGAITASSSDTSVATVGTINQNSATVPISSVSDTTGTAVITVNIAETANYQAASFTVNVKASFREYLYGFDLTESDQNPATRVAYPSDVENASFSAAKVTGTTFSYGGWPSAVGEKFMPRPCMLKYDGTVDYYLDPNDLTKKADGTASDVANVNYGGNAMMEWPKIYVKRWSSGGVYHFRCSDVKVDEDYDCWSNYDKNNNEIPHFYTPIFFGSKDSSNRLRSISGQTNWVTTGGAQAEIDAAKRNGDIWTIEELADRLLIQDLLVMMFKHTDLQLVAGMGVVSASAAIGQGTMNTKGMFWGDVSGKTSGVKVFGMENWWGNIYRRLVGWISDGGSEKVKITRGTKDGSTGQDYNLTGSGYLTVESISWNGNCINTMTTKPYGRLPKTTAGSTTTYEADYAYVYTSGVRVAIVGGDWDDGLNAGPFTVHLGGGAALSHPSIGAALSCKPLAAA